MVASPLNGNFAMKFFCRIVLIIGVFTAWTGLGNAAEPSLRIATFDVDATPPVGYMMAYDKCVRQDDLPLRCRGVVLLGAEQPIVLCAVNCCSNSVAAVGGS